MLKKYLYKIVFLLILTASLACQEKGEKKTSSKVVANSTEKKHYLAFDDIKQLRTYLSYKGRSTPLVSAHRGGPMPGFPENALETFENALKYAPCMLECDVSKAKDGTLVMMHDDELDRTTTGSGLVKEYTASKLRKLKLKDNDGKETNFSIPTLDETLQWAKGKAILSIDVKRSITPEEIVQAVHKNKAQAYSVIIVYNIDALKAYHKLDPSLMISASAGDLDTLGKIFNSGVDKSSLLIFVGINEPQAEVYQALHKEGILSILGTMHNLDNSALKKGVSVYQKLLKNGADILATDNVILAARAITEME